MRGIVEAALGYEEPVHGRIVVDRSYDVPDLAGYNVAGTVVYVHHKVPDTLKLSTGRSMNIIEPLVIHEVVEKSLMIKMGFGYTDAHYMAYAAEHRYFKERGYSDTEIKEYDDLMLSLEGMARKPENLTNVPPDWDSTPNKPATHRGS